MWLETTTKFYRNNSNLKFRLGPNNECKMSIILLSMLFCKSIDFKYYSHYQSLLRYISRTYSITKQNQVLSTIMLQVHPDVKGSNRYVAGTKLQMRKGATSHKKPSCRYHDVSLTKEGENINTMNQVDIFFNLMILKQC